MPVSKGRYDFIPDSQVGTEGVDEGDSRRRAAIDAIVRDDVVKLDEGHERADHTMVGLRRASDACS